MTLNRSIGRLLPLLLALLLGACGGAGDSNGNAPVPPASTQPPSAVTGSRTLAVAPTYQQTEVWCWAAAAEMIFRAYQMPNLNTVGNFQCGIVAAYYGPSHVCFHNCSLCRSGIGSMSEMKALIDGYGLVANSVVRSPVLSSRLSFRALPFNEVASQISVGRPILAGISPNGLTYPNISEHVVVIVGFASDTQGQTLIVNDPFPYEAFPFMRNPYTASGGRLLQLGRYAISYAAFVSQLRWGNTLDQIR